MWEKGGNIFRRIAGVRWMGEGGVWKVQRSRMATIRLAEMGEIL